MRLELRLGPPGSGDISDAISEMIRISKLLTVDVIVKINGVDVMVFPSSTVEYTFEQYRIAQRKPESKYRLAVGE